MLIQVSVLFFRRVLIERKIKIYPARWPDKLPAEARENGKHSQSPITGNELLNDTSGAEIPGSNPFHFHKSLNFSSFICSFWCR